MRKFVLTCLLAITIGGAQTIKAVMLASEGERRNGGLPPSPEMELPAEATPAGPGGRDEAMRVMTIKARPLPRAQPLPKGPAKPQPTPRPAPNATPAPVVPTPTPPTTRPT